ncbi:hypothetical protein BJX61DRAFT_151631 [Aspergillus egyptiacus]|nr:hypothetical protein BJX61DRAFT_151631 [Aspergillus egyptiacus]
MPSSLGFNRPRKSTKSSAASNISASSKTSKPPAEKPKDSPKAQTTVSRSAGPSGAGYTSKATPAPSPPAESKGKETGAPNVFEYLDADSDSDSDTGSDVTSSESDDDDLRPPFPPTTKPKAPTTRQPNTAVPVQSRSRTSPAKPTKEAQPPGAFDTSPVAAPAQPARNPANRRPSTDAASSIVGSVIEGSLPPEHRNLELVPEDYYPRNSPTLRRPSFPPSPPQSPEEDLHRSGRKIRRGSKSSSRPPTGYALLAYRLSASAENKEHTSLPPLYRRFGDINHRVLLYLQDEISQLEEELRVLDDYEEMQRRGAAEQEGTRVPPASRRMDIQAQAYSSLHYRREEVMGALIQKTEQYNNALAAYSKVLQILPRAANSDIDTYRKWMKANNPIAANETRFLDHPRDLISLTPKLPTTAAAAAAAATTTTFKRPSPFHSAIIIASAAIVLPLVAFSIVAEFSGRMIVVAVVGGAAAAAASHYSAGTEQLARSQDGWRCATIYFGFMAVAALCIS